MAATSIGTFDGKSWEALCQQVFKRKFACDGYQQIPASPGDFGLEGFTLKTGYGYQCYCPEKNYTRQELYVAQRDKITTDLGKLKINQVELAKRFGATKLSHWVFVTPEIDKNSLLAHARIKELEVRSWNLPILAPDFSVLLHDSGHYIVEINEIRIAAGEAIDFYVSQPCFPPLSGPPEFYDGNVQRKSRARLAPKKTSHRFESLVQQLHQQTLESFLEADAHFRRIEVTAPTVYFRLVRLINEYEKQVIETAATWTGSAEVLTVSLRDGLADRIAKELAPQFSETNSSTVARHMVARWIAICELDYD